MVEGAITALQVKDAHGHFKSNEGEEVTDWGGSLTRVDEL